MPDFQSLAREAEFLHRFRRTLVGPDDVLVFGSSDAGPGFNDLLVCLDRATGALRWQFGGRETPQDFLSPVCAETAHVYVGRSNGVLYALDRRTGAEAWRLPRGRGVSVPIFHGKSLVVSEAPAGILFVDAFTGEVLQGAHDALHDAPPGLRALLFRHAHLLFQITSDGVLTRVAGDWPAGWSARASAHTFSAASLFVATSYNQLRSIDLGDGNELWCTEGPVDVKRLESDGRTLWTASSGGAICAFDALTGEPKWSRKLAAASSMVEWKGRLYLDVTSKVAVLDGATGESVGEIALEGAPYGPMAVDGETLFVARAAEPEVVLHAVPVGAGGVKWRAVIGGYGLS